eukprot:scaffold95369_cov25-Tisochrysis_lutea.AAC.5
MPSFAAAAVAAAASPSPLEPNSRIAKAVQWPSGARGAAGVASATATNAESDAGSAAAETTSCAWYAHSKCDVSSERQKTAREEWARSVPPSAGKARKRSASSGSSGWASVASNGQQRAIRREGCGDGGALAVEADGPAGPATYCRPRGERRGGPCARGRRKRGSGLVRRSGRGGWRHGLPQLELSVVGSSERDEECGVEGECCERPHVGLRCARRQLPRPISQRP